jgi:hypothetical protein
MSFFALNSALLPLTLSFIHNSEIDAVVEVKKSLLFENVLYGEQYFYKMFCALNKMCTFEQVSK